MVMAPMVMAPMVMAPNGHGPTVMAPMVVANLPGGPGPIRASRPALKCLDLCPALARYNSGGYTLKTLPSEPRIIMLRSHPLPPA